MLRAALPLLAAAGAACGDSGNCFKAEATFSPTAPDFVGVVSKVTYESGQAPAGVDISQYAAWITVAPHTAPNSAVLLSRSTPVFERALYGTHLTSACVIAVGDRIEVWHDNRWALGTAEAPVGDTLYFPTQVRIRP